MNKKRVTALLLLVLALVFAFSSCASNDDIQSGHIAPDKILRVATTLPEEVYTPLVREFYARTGYWSQVTILDETDLAAAFESSNYDFFLGGGSDYYENHSTDFSKELPSLENISAEFKSTDGTWFGITTDPVVCIYNRMLGSIELAPSTWSELLKEDLSTIAFADVKTDDDSLAALAEMVQHRGEYGVNEMIRVVYRAGAHEYLKTMRDAVEAVYTGRFPMGIVTESEAWQYIDGDAGGENTLYISYLMDGTITVTEGAAISSRAINTDAAYAFAEFVTSEDAQNYLSSTLGLRPTLVTAKVPPRRAPLETLGVTPYESGWIYERKQSILSYWETLAEAK